MKNDVTIENTMYEVDEIIEKCISCGLCKSLCPVFKQIKNEAISPRGKVSELKNKAYADILYKCTLCKSCEEKCPLKLKLPDAFRKARSVLVNKGKETKANKEMIKNIGNERNPFGKNPDNKNSLYCC